MMGLIDYFRSKRGGTAATAKERLQIIIAHERGSCRSSLDFLPALRREMLEVVRRYVHVDPEQVQIHVEREGDYEVLEVNVTLPEEAAARREDAMA